MPSPQALLQAAQTVLATVRSAIFPRANHLPARKGSQSLAAGPLLNLAGILALRQPCPTGFRSHSNEMRHGMDRIPHTLCPNVLSPAIYRHRIVARRKKRLWVWQVFRFQSPLTGCGPVPGRVQSAPDAGLVLQQVTRVLHLPRHK